MPAGQQSLEDLILRSAQGDRASFALLYDRTSAKLFATVSRILNRGLLAEDALQDAYVKIWRNASTFDPGQGSAIAWMAAIARNRAIDIRRSRHGSAETVELSETREADAGLVTSQKDLAETDALARCLSRLRGDDREMVLLAYCHGYSREELAERAARPVGTVKVRLHRALSSLRTCLEKADAGA